jgi:hypothetical protein
MIKVKLPVQSSTSATPELATKQVEAADLTDRKRKRRVLPKQQLQLPHLSLSIEDRASSLRSNFRPRPKRIVPRSPEVSRSRPVKSPHSSSLTKLRLLSSPVEARHSLISPQPPSYQPHQSNVPQSSALVSPYRFACVQGTTSALASNARNSPVVFHRTKSPLTRFRQGSPFRHSLTKSLFDGRTSTAVQSYREDVR